MRESHLVIVPHTHWDREWYRTHEQFRYKLVGLLDRVLELLESDPEFTHFTLDGQVVVLDDYLEVRPDARDRIAKLIRHGRLLIGPWYVLPDEWLVSGEALIRNIRLGVERAAAFGGAMQLGYVPDQFGHIGQLPQIFAGFGFDAAVLWRGVGADIDRSLFEWEAPDGTRLLTVYLKSGYGNASNLPLEVDALTRKLATEIHAQRDSRLGKSLLLMNGSDHLEPLPGLPAALREATARLEGVSFEVATLPRFVDLARGETTQRLQRHRGELRSGLRSPLLVGCASARIAQKRSDFINDRLLTRYLEPIAAWVESLGGDPDCSMLDYMWRVALENHPHDSICGCSIDAVHEQMETRFARVRESAEAHLSRMQRELGCRVRALPARPRRAEESTSLVVWNPGAAGRSLVEGEIEHDVAAGAKRPALHLRDAAGTRIAVHAEQSRPGEVLAEYVLPAAAIRSIIAGFPSEFMGLVVVAITWKRRSGCLEIDLQLGEAALSGFDAAAARSAIARILEEEAEQQVRFRARRRASVRIRFVDALPGCGLRVYRIARGKAGTDSALRAETRDGVAVIANEFWQITVDDRGRIELLELRTGTRIPDALRIVDDGDRGDEYNFDPIVDDQPISEPWNVRVRLLPASEAEVGLELDLSLRVPREIAPDRTRRSYKGVGLPVRVTLRLAAGLDRVDVGLTISNTARDHRTRVWFRAPFVAEVFEVESALEIAQRPIAAPEPGRDRPAEFPIGTVPHRSFATLERDGLAMTVANRGSPEVEAVEAVEAGDPASYLALTLVRAVGWLSRGDLVMRPGHAGPGLATPGAQVPGPHQAEFSVRLHAAGDPNRAADAHRFAHPPIAFVGGIDSGSMPDGSPRFIEDGSRLLSCDDPSIVVSAIEPAGDGSTRFRIVNFSNRARKVNLCWNGEDRAHFEALDLAGRPLLTPLQLLNSPIELRPWQIASFRARSS
ncbi:MAG: hypothetical protein VCE43_09010 [Myxococcota bacterium]